MKSQSFALKFKAALRCGVPLVYLRTWDQPAAVDLIAGSFPRRPIWTWDCARGIRPANNAAVGWPDGDPSLYQDAMAALEVAASMPAKGILLLIGGDRVAAEFRPATAMLMLRDAYKRTGRVLVCLGSHHAPAAELGSDGYVIEDPMPDEGRRREIAVATARGANIELTPELVDACASYTRGLSEYGCEQTVALACTPGGLDVDVLRENWIEAVNSVPGLTVMRELPGAEGVAGLAEILAYLVALRNGRDPPQAIVFCDEIEKHIAGAGGDTSGTSQSILGAKLSHMEDTKAAGILAIGPPGCGKTLVAQVAGSILGIPTIALDLGALKGSLVGETEEKTRRAFAALRALAGRQFWISTCNGLGAMPPELLRRYTDGVWFFDLPTAEERAAIWKVHMTAFGLVDETPWKHDQDWTGADIRNVCRQAWRTKRTIAQVSERYVPSSRAAKATIESLRRMANGTFFSASMPGAYRLPDPNQTARRFSSEDE